MQRNCEFCGQPFEAKRDRARFCGSSCRARATKRRQRESESSSEALTQSCEAAASGGGDREEPPLVREVRKALADAGKSGWRAQQAVQLAQKLSTPGEPGSASLSKELDRLMNELMAGVVVETDELDEITGNVVPMRRRRV